MSEYPMYIHMAYKERQNRAITFFKLILMIPWVVWLYLWSIAFQLMVVLGWFILLFTGKWPQEFFSFGESYFRFQARLSAWLIYLNSKWPSFGGQPDDEWGLSLTLERQQRYNRWKTGFRLILMIPAALLAGYGVAMYILFFWFLAFWAILFTGRLPTWCYRHLADSFAYLQRFNAYQYLLIEAYPPIKGQDEAPAATAPAPPLTAPAVGTSSEG